MGECVCVWGVPMCWGMGAGGRLGGGGALLRQLKNRKRGPFSSPFCPLSLPPSPPPSPSCAGPALMKLSFSRLSATSAAYSASPFSEGGKGGEGVVDRVGGGRGVGDDDLGRAQRTHA